MSKIKKFLINIWEDESGQGATEYILILVVIGVLVIAFKGKIVQIIADKTDAVGGKIGGFITAISGP